jgi:hypothetical protein
MKTKTLVICDIQPDYKEHFHSKLVVNALNLARQYLANRNKVYWFWNGPELSMSPENVLKDWLYDIIADYNLFEIDYNDEYFIETEYTLINILFDDIKFIDKTYGTLRAPIDNGYDIDSIQYLLSYMHQNNYGDFENCDFNDLLFSIDINDTFKLTETIKLIQYLNNQGEVFTFKDADKNVSYVLIGGGREQCLLELQLQMLAFGLNVEVNEDLTY